MIDRGLQTLGATVPSAAGLAPRSQHHGKAIDTTCQRAKICGFGDAANVKKRDLERKIRWYAPLSSCYGGPDRALSTGKTLLLYLCFDDSNLAWWVHHFASPRAAGSTFDNSHADSQRGRECSSSSSTPRSLNTRPERADKKRTALSHQRIPHSHL